MLHHLIDDAARREPEATAVIVGEQVVSFGELAELIDDAAAVIASRTAVGDRVALLGWNSLELLVLLYAVPAAGRIAAPLNARLHPRELTAQLEQIGASLLVGEAALLATLDTAVPRMTIGTERGDRSSDGFPAGDDAAVAWLIFTSGSTGRAKAAMLTHRSLLAAVDAANGARPVGAEDCYLYPFPLFHVAAYNVLVQHRHRRPVVLLRSFDAGEVLDACRRHRVTTLSLAPTMLTMLLDHPEFDRDALQTVRTIGYGASSIGDPLLRRVLAETGCGLSQGYGMTELSGNACFLDADDHRLAASSRPELLRSAGRPAPGVELRLAADGEILVRAAQQMLGYWNEPELSSRAIVDGWLHTGDLGRIDDDGYLYVVDRLKDVIITGGENVASPRGRRRPRRSPGGPSGRCRRCARRALGRGGVCGGLAACRCLPRTHRADRPRPRRSGRLQATAPRRRRRRAAGQRRRKGRQATAARARRRTRSRLTPGVAAAGAPAASAVPVADRRGLQAGWSAATGSSRAARTAGATPASTPTATATANPPIHA